ncbi:MAG: hypothetical protein V2I33_24245, partial [Kangiellaceae bacterium]|nr:hypothetical protein [Kangiellaceae bacterium]
HDFIQGDWFRIADIGHCRLYQHPRPNGSSNPHEGKINPNNQGVQFRQNLDQGWNRLVRNLDGLL